VQVPGREVLLGTRRVFDVRTTDDGNDSVTAPVEADAVISFEVPAMVVGRAVQLSAAPLASTPSGNWPAVQFVPLAASAVAVATLPAGTT